MRALFRILALAAVIACQPTPARADIYKLVDENGVVHLSDRPLGPGSVVVVRGPRRGVARPDYAANRRRYSGLIDRAAGRLRVDRALVHAVVHVESAYDARAVSRKGAVGLMQLMPGTARRYGVRDRYDAAQNVYGGVRYLYDLLVRFGDVVLALAAYNAGENAVLRYGGKVPPFPETRGYVRKVLTRYREIRGRS